MSTATSSIAFKLELQRAGRDATIHRFRGDYSYAELCTAISALWDERPKALVLEYIDDEGDAIRFNTEAEWAECAQLHAESGKAVLRLTGKRAKDIRKFEVNDSGFDTCSASSSSSDDDEGQGELVDPTIPPSASAEVCHSAPFAEPAGTQDNFDLCEEGEKSETHQDTAGDAHEEDEESYTDYGDQEDEGEEYYCEDEVFEYEVEDDDDAGDIYSKSVAPTMTQAEKDAESLNTKVLELLSVCPEMSAEEANRALIASDYNVALALDRRFSAQGGGVGVTFNYAGKGAGLAALTGVADTSGHVVELPTVGSVPHCFFDHEVSAPPKHPQLHNSAAATRVTQSQQPRKKSKRRGEK